ncbi:hypothetical protein EDI_017260 [Entamoeba dispar SAW760]|uniref:Uncharacterized protein n=1 Tax=Entamoeba dispar (strain ATCC PRA-260 / SAW760) TaxID=370354 RepID=B0EAQ5_ENTDS|nr:uncharacterized protein EDI_017260 [Entamoeba dispar SAW760]EDR28404.1 hypothetical protein EDI_017260 [Entamoeba dispar SAW760]|eukprot:EDR28404.1 hypothetical protein EDI_017260 [Entamoeba dispar SAW760]
METSLTYKTTLPNFLQEEKKKRGRKRKAFNLEETRKRKRENRANANRNDYGNEGFLMMILYYLGCTIKMKRIIKEGIYQKLKIEELSYQNIVLISRNQIEKEIEQSNILKGMTEQTRYKRNMIFIITDNQLLDILRDFFGFSFEECVKKKPEKKFMPERRVLEHIILSKEWNKKEMIDEGCIFYDNIKSFFNGIEEIEFSIDIVNSLYEAQQVNSVISSSFI